MGGAQYVRRPGGATSMSGANFAFTKIGASRYDLSDPYHAALTVGWGAFMGTIGGLYILINLLFALAYFLVPGSVANARPGALIDAFFFSVETFATVGYGDFRPSTPYAHWVATLEIVVGMMFTAIVTGLIFVRFSKPRAKIIFADSPIITLHNGAPTLMIRLGNGRMNILTDLKLRLSALITEVGEEGLSFRRSVDLPLLTDRYAIFALTITLQHRLDTGPLAGLTEERMLGEEMRFFLTVEAHDTSLGADVHALHTYAATDMAWGRRYADATTQSDTGGAQTDLRRVSLLEPEDRA